MCGFLGIISKEGDVSYDLYNGLLTLQHRGQDSAGILTFNGEELILEKGVGFVNDLFNEKNLPKLKGNLGIAHVRYPTQASDPNKNIHPFVTYTPFGIGMCNNGNLINYPQLKEELQKKLHRRMQSDCDAELELKIFAHELEKEIKEGDVPADGLFAAVGKTMDRLNGSYSIVSLIADKGLLAFRDPLAIRPLVFGIKRSNGKVLSYGFASETVALDTLGFEIVKDLEPGEAIFVDTAFKVHSKVVRKGERKHCMFEWVYFARADSVIENKGVYEVRLNLGRELAELWKKSGKEADVVIPVPDTSRTAAISFAQEVGLPYVEGLLKNRYIASTFIMPNQQKRETSVRLKLNPVIREIKGKKIILIDDSIVRGTTSKRIIDMVRKAGAKEIHFLVTCPPLKFPCFYAIDFANKTELVAADRETEEIKKQIGADTLIYQTIEGLDKSIGLGDKLCNACLHGKYPTPLSEEQAKLLGETRARERGEIIPLKASA